MFKNDKETTGIEYILALFVIIILSIPVGMWTDRNLEFYLSMIKKTAVHVPFILSWLLTVLLNGIILVIDLILEIVRLAM